MKYILLVFFAFFFNSVYAEWQDCSKAISSTWMPQIAKALLEENPTITSRRPKEISDAYNRRDSGKSLSALLDLYNCTWMAAEPTTGNAGLYVWKFTEKRFGSTIQNRLENSPNTFYASLVGGPRIATTSDLNHCYFVSYFDERGNDIENGAFLLIRNVKIPFPEKVSSCRGS
jgi:hypothetical protein